MGEDGEDPAAGGMAQWNLEILMCGREDKGVIREMTV